MHAIQGAMAVRREREKREHRRQSQQRKGQSPTASTLSLVIAEPPTKTESSLTAFHLGVVFILLGFLLVFSGMISGGGKNDAGVPDKDAADYSRLLGVGACLIMLGLVMVMVNRIITEREEEELAKYVHTRLARTRSGHALVREAEADMPVLQVPRRGLRHKPSINGRKNTKQSLLKMPSSGMAHSGSRQNIVQVHAPAPSPTPQDTVVDTNGRCTSVRVTSPPRETAFAIENELLITTTATMASTVNNNDDGRIVASLVEARQREALTKKKRKEENSQEEQQEE